MKFELKDMYNFLLSHTFPGLLVLIEILLALQWFAKLEVLKFLQKIWSTTQTGNTIILLVLAYAFSTLLGIILDGVHHFFLEDIWDIRQQEKEEKFNAISDNLKMDVYKHFLDDDLWYYYEAYANISFAMFPGGFLLYYWLSYIMHFGGLYFWIPMLLYVLVFGITLIEAICTKWRYENDEEQFIDAYGKK
jgi:hypothetical protein